LAMGGGTRNLGPGGAGGEEGVPLFGAGCEEVASERAPLLGGGGAGRAVEFACETLDPGAVGGGGGGALERKATLWSSICFSWR
jgi:hypothetical protein